VFHTFQPGKPANHLTRNCSWLDDILAGHVRPFGPARPSVPAAPSPLTRANTVAVPPRLGNLGNQNNAGNAGVNQVDHSYNQEFYAGGPVAGQNEYKEHDQSYMVFETKRNFKQSLYRRSLEVNAIMSAVPKLMYWSDQAIVSETSASEVTSSPWTFLSWPSLFSFSSRSSAIRPFSCSI
jgi:hypothetical protein